MIQLNQVLGKQLTVGEKREENPITIVIKATKSIILEDYHAY